MDLIAQYAELQTAVSGLMQALNRKSIQCEELRRKYHDEQARANALSETLADFAHALCKARDYAHAQHGGPHLLAAECQRPLCKMITDALGDEVVNREDPPAVERALAKS